MIPFVDPEVPEEQRMTKGVEEIFGKFGGLEKIRTNYEKINNRRRYSS